LLKNLPETIGQLQSLGKLALFNNKLDSLPETITLLSSLRELNLDCNQLKVLPAAALFGKFNGIERGQAALFWPRAILYPIPQLLSTSTLRNIKIPLFCPQW